MEKRGRHDAIMRLIDEKPIAKQSELGKELQGLGYSVTQASVSRDLVELGILKTGGRYRRGGSAASLMRFGTVTFAAAGPNLVIGKCASGMASALTVQIDRMNVEGIVGTIAGDDTIFIAVSDGKAQTLVLDQLNRNFR